MTAPANERNQDVADLYHQAEVEGLASFGAVYTPKKNSILVLSHVVKHDHKLTAEVATFAKERYDELLSNMNTSKRFSPQQFKQIVYLTNTLNTIEEDQQQTNETKKGYFSFLGKKDQPPNSTKQQRDEDIRKIVQSQFDAYVYGKPELADYKNAIDSISQAPASEKKVLQLKTLVLAGKLTEAEILIREFSKEFSVKINGSFEGEIDDTINVKLTNFKLDRSLILETKLNRAEIKRIAFIADQVGKHGLHLQVGRYPGGVEPPTDIYDAFRKMKDFYLGQQNEITVYPYDALILQAIIQSPDVDENTKAEASSYLQNLVEANLGSLPKKALENIYSHLDYASSKDLNAALGRSTDLSHIAITSPEGARTLARFLCQKKVISQGGWCQVWIDKHSHKIEGYAVSIKNRATMPKAIRENGDTSQLLKVLVKADGSIVVNPEHDDVGALIEKDEETDFEKQIREGLARELKLEEGTFNVASVDLQKIPKMSQTQLEKASYAIAEVLLSDTFICENTSTYPTTAASHATSPNGLHEVDFFFDKNYNLINYHARDSEDFNKILPADFIHIRTTVHGTANIAYELNTIKIESEFAKPEDKDTLLKMTWTNINRDLGKPLKDQMGLSTAKRNPAEFEFNYQRKLYNMFIDRDKPRINLE